MGGDKLSMVGTKTLVITDLPGVYLHDSGGVMVGPSTKALTDAGLSPGRTWKARWCQQPGRLTAAFAFQDGVVANIQAEGDEARAISVALLSTTAASDEEPPADAVDSAISSEILARFVEPHQELRTRSNLPVAVLDLLASGFVDLHFVLKGGRVRLTHEGTNRLVVDAPLDAFRVSCTDHRLDLEGRVPFADHMVEKLGIHFSDAETANAAATIAANQLRTTRSTTAQSAHPQEMTDVVAGVHVYGRLAGEVCDGSRFDLVIRATSLELRDQASHGRQHRFDLTSPTTGVEGRGSRFLICDESTGPLRIELTSEHLHRHVQQHPAIAEAARRSSLHGPFLGLLPAGQPVRVNLASDEITFDSTETVEPMSFSDIGSIEPNLSAASCHLQLKTRSNRTCSITAELSTLEGFYGSLKGRIVASRARDAETVAHGILGREADWFMYSCFGPLLELHQRLVERWPDHQAPSAVGQPSNDPERQAMVEGLAAAISPLREHLETVVNALPVFIVEQDEALFRLAGQPVPKFLAGTPELYSRAFGGARTLLADLARMERELSRIESLRTRVAGSQTQLLGLAAGATAALGMSLVTGMPFFLLAPAAQGARMALGQGKENKQGKELLKSVTESTTTYWNNMLIRVLPPVAHRLLEAVYSSRSRLAGELTRRSQNVEATERVAIVQALAHRFGRLEAFRAFPADTRHSRPRAQATELLRRLQNGYKQAAFVPF